MKNTLNVTACAAILRSVNWADSHLLVQLFALALLNVMVIAGNCLVIAAVLYSSKLHSVTNLFIVSLAVADLLVGVAVLPFSTGRELFKVWIFGNVWCKIWLALDVWMCTASILNLCAISLDRYVAVTRPITYPSIMSRKRAKWLIAGLWILSFVICFPPLIGWRDKVQEDDAPHETSTMEHTTPSAAASAATPQEQQLCPWKCELTNEAGYVVYSALGSFYLPMFVMLFFYWRIYRAAVRTTRAINQGFRTTKGSKGLRNRFDEQRLTLRIHRGRGSTERRHHCTGSPHSNGSSSTLTTLGSGSPSPSNRRHERIKISVSYPSSENLSTLKPTPPNHLPVVMSTSPSSYTVRYSVNGDKMDENSSRSDGRLRVHRGGSSRRALTPNSDIVSLERPPTSPSTVSEDGRTKLISRKMGKRNIKFQVKRFRMETKAAKTLGIIVGGFILCWLPFFTMYLIRAFCEDCIHPLVFSVLFWLGYVNSAINPLIYALFSKDFRFAFKRIICKCFCKGGNGKGSRRGSAGSQLQERHFRSASYNRQGNSLGEESDPGGDPSDSR
ncbi:octopamine receptor Oamb [Coccinella septempunctata]|uniref:octopamine receptor Oamb n=1 Tax=Coccinella septempunctata TaxID=41139 RepID=UPI001D08338F|nr:octopamine receptor Oamb [Coccinella septempunctata]